MPFIDPAVQREYQRDWIAQRRADYLADKRCVMCGSVDRLELDHIDGSTKVSHRIWSWAIERRAVELAKCQVLCHDHHIAKSKAFRLAAGLARHHRHVQQARVPVYPVQGRQEGRERPSST